MRVTSFVLKGLGAQNGLEITKLDELKIPSKTVILEFCISFSQYNKTYFLLRKNEINRSQSCDTFSI